MWRNYSVHRLSILFSLCAFLLSCSGNSPTIISLDTRLEQVYDQETWREELRLFLLVSDRDGSEDIQEIDIAFDREELLWTLMDEDIVTIRKAGEIWMGHPGLSMPGGEPFPEGSYRVILIDQLGKSSETLFRIGKDGTSERGYPEIVKPRGEDELGYMLFPDRGAWEELKWVSYDEEGTVLETTEAVMDEEGKLLFPDEINQNENDTEGAPNRWFQLFGYQSSEKRSYRIKIR